MILYEILRVAGCENNDYINTLNASGLFNCKNMQIQLINKPICSFTLCAFKKTQINLPVGFFVCIN